MSEAQERRRDRLREFAASAAAPVRGAVRFVQQWVLRKSGGAARPARLHELPQAVLAQIFTQLETRDQLSLSIASQALNLAARASLRHFIIRCRCVNSTPCPPLPPTLALSRPPPRHTRRRPLGRRDAGGLRPRPQDAALSGLSLCSDVIIQFFPDPEDTDEDGAWQGWAASGVDGAAVADAAARLLARLPHCRPRSNSPAFKLDIEMQSCGAAQARVLVSASELEDALHAAGALPKITEIFLDGDAELVLDGGLGALVCSVNTLDACKNLTDAYDYPPGTAYTGIQVMSVSLPSFAAAANFGLVVAQGAFPSLLSLGIHWEGADEHGAHGEAACLRLRDAVNAALAARPEAADFDWEEMREMLFSGAHERACVAHRGSPCECWAVFVDLRLAPLWEFSDWDDIPARMAPHRRTASYVDLHFLSHLGALTSLQLNRVLPATVALDRATGELELSGDFALAGLPSLRRLELAGVDCDAMDGFGDLINGWGELARLAGAAPALRELVVAPLGRAADLHHLTSLTSLTLGLSRDELQESELRGGSFAWEDLCAMSHLKELKLTGTAAAPPAAAGARFNLFMSADEPGMGANVLAGLSSLERFEFALDAAHWNDGAGTCSCAECFVAHVLDTFASHMPQLQTLVAHFEDAKGTLDSPADHRFFKELGFCNTMAFVSAEEGHEWGAHWCVAHRGPKVCFHRGGVGAGHHHGDEDEDEDEGEDGDDDEVDVSDDEGEE
jgi:hypothetical protein